MLFVFRHIYHLKTICTDTSSGTAGANNGQVSAYGTGARLVNGMYVTYDVGDFTQIVVFYAG